MVDYRNKKIFALSFILSLFSLKAEATQADFADEPVVYQNAHYHQVAKEQTASAKEDGEPQQQVSIAVYTGTPGKIEKSKVNCVVTKVHRTKVFTPTRGASVASGQERIKLALDNAPSDKNNETDNSEGTSENEGNIFETIGYTREILRHEIANPAGVFEEVG